MGICGATEQVGSVTTLLLRSPAHQPCGEQCGSRDLVRSVEASAASPARLAMVLAPTSIRRAGPTPAPSAVAPGPCAACRAAASDLIVREIPCAWTLTRCITCDAAGPLERRIGNIQPGWSARARLTHPLNVAPWGPRSGSSPRRVTSQTRPPPREREAGAADPSTVARPRSSGP